VAFYLSINFVCIIRKSEANTKQEDVDVYECMDNFHNYIIEKTNNISTEASKRKTLKSTKYENTG